MDKELIIRAAESAISDLKFDCLVKAVYQPPGKDVWCVQFTNKYGEVCDEFRDRAEKENSPEVVREKIKRHLFRMKRAGRVRIRQARDAENRQESAFPYLPDVTRVTKVADVAMEGVEQVMSQAPPIVSKVIDQLSHLASAVFEGVPSTVAELTTKRAARLPAKKKRAPKNKKHAKPKVKKAIRGKNKKSATKARATSKKAVTTPAGGKKAATTGARSKKGTKNKRRRIARKPATKKSRTIKKSSRRRA